MKDQRIDDRYRILRSLVHGEMGHNDSLLKWEAAIQHIRHGVMGDQAQSDACAADQPVSIKSFTKCGGRWGLRP